MVRKQALVRTALGIALAIGIASASRAEDAAPVRIGVLTDMVRHVSRYHGSGLAACGADGGQGFGGKVLGRPIEVISGDHQAKADVGATLRATGLTTTAPTSSSMSPNRPLRSRFRNWRARTIRS